MSAASFLTELAAAGIRVTRDGDNLNVRGEPGVSLAPYLDRIRDHKPALLTELLQVRIIAILNVEPTHFDRAEYERLLTMWNAQETPENAL